MSLDALDRMITERTRRSPTFAYMLSLAQAESDNDYDVAHGNAVTGPELDWLEAHDHPLPVSIAAAGGKRAKTTDAIEPVSGA